MKRWLLLLLVIGVGAYLLFPELVPEELTDTLGEGGEAIRQLASDAADSVGAHVPGGSESDASDVSNGPQLLPSDTTSRELALIAAAEGGNGDEVARLLRAGADVNGRATNGMTPLLAAVAARNERMANRLIQAGAQADARMTNGRTGLMIAAANGDDSLVTLLVNAGANPNIQSKAGNFALMEAAKRGSLRSTQTLLSAGADVSMTADNGWTALDMAEQKGHSNVAKALRVARQ